MKVIKRDGKRTEFNLNKISNAIIRANTNLSEEMSAEDVDRIAKIVENKCFKFGEIIKVEDIQDIVEDTLLKSKFNQTAKAYILFRDNRSRIRENKSKLFRHLDYS